MRMSGNTILITGGGSGIGRGLAEVFHSLGNRVIIAGRRQAVLDEVVEANPGMASAVFDTSDAGSIRPFATRLVKEYPALNVIINNAGIMRPENLLSSAGDLTDMEATIGTNLTGPIRLITALLPHLQSQGEAAIINVSSGLAFVPAGAYPTYSATKAAFHSYTQALRQQLSQSAIQVIEIIPPVVATNLTPEIASSPLAMPLHEYVGETINILTTQPEVAEILVEQVKPFRFAERDGNYDSIYKFFNQGASANTH